ncbi:MAG: hypothetical protein OP8BY_0051 [Candidatus Saccharicenans subterraneus]|uniref:Uncharacterized protein n=1 Tax=Candidatus Saccharicenans subterraneus TaxID=2508984 RepID=A0A3E2BM41_9BACT|nr:MAG: hypothetical protein OP8BY_0051 [Candidatus Saccharicenans subterraneum]
MGRSGFLFVGIRSDMEKVGKNPYKSGWPGRILASAKESSWPG